MPSSATPRALRPFRRSASACFALVMCFSSAALLDNNANAQARGQTRDIIRTLIAEAQDVQQRNHLTISEPEFAERYDGDIDIAVVQQAIIRRQHRDPFIDAYIRWQLTSFEPTLPDMNDRDRARFLQQIPSMVENPRAEQHRVALFERVAETERFSDEQFGQLQRMSAELDEKTEAAESRNRPAVQFREWIREQVDQTGDERLALQLAAEHCAATIQAGWSTRAIKTEISQRCTEAAAGGSLSVEDRRHVLATLEQLVGLQRRSINVITFMGDGSVRVTFSNAAVHRRDIDNWRSRLFDEDRNGDAS